MALIAVSSHFQKAVQYLGTCDGTAALKGRIVLLPALYALAECALQSGRQGLAEPSSPKSWRPSLIQALALLLLPFLS